MSGHSSSQKLLHVIGIVTLAYGCGSSAPAETEKESTVPVSATSDPGSAGQLQSHEKGGRDLNPYLHIIEKQGRVTSRGVGPAGTLSSSFAAFQELQSRASSQELRSLLVHQSPAVRVYAFYALAERYPALPLTEELAPLSEDWQGLKTQFGCVVRHQTVGELAITKVYERLSASDSETALWQLSLYSNN